MDDKKRRKLKAVILLPNWHVKITIQSQVMTTHALASQHYYMSQRLSKKQLFTIYLAAKHQKHSKLRVTNIGGEPVDFLMVLNGRLL